MTSLMIPMSTSALSSHDTTAQLSAPAAPSSPVQLPVHLTPFIGREQAMRLYQRFAERLQSELDTEPDEARMGLFERVQRGGI